MRWIVAVSVPFFLSLTAGCGSVSSEPSQGDKDVLGQLSSAGSDLSQSHNIEFVSVFTLEAQALLARNKLEPLGFSIHIAKSRRPGRRGMDDIFTMTATKSLIPTPENVGKTRAEFESITSRHQGEYDGWGAAVVPLPGTTN